MRALGDLRDLGDRRGRLRGQSLEVKKGGFHGSHHTRRGRGNHELVQELVAIASINPAYMREGDSQSLYGEAGVAEYVAETLAAGRSTSSSLKSCPAVPMSSRSWKGARRRRKDAGSFGKLIWIRSR